MTPATSRAPIRTPGIGRGWPVDCSRSGGKGQGAVALGEGFGAQSDDESNNGMNTAHVGATTYLIELSV